MNKDVIYIEPEDDITDIINRLKAAKQKVVALVPPGKPSVLRSAVNIKLISKAATEASKAVVMVTADQSIIKLAAAANIPVAKTLQSRPVVPTEDSSLLQESNEEVIDESEAEAESTPAEAKATEKTPDQVINSAELESDLAEDKKGKQGKKDKTKIPNFDKFRKWIILGAVAVILLVGFLVWAIIFAPAAKIIVSIRSTASNFSENISFTLDQSTEDLAAGRFFLDERKLENTAEVEMDATGKKNIGNKASGTMSVTYPFRLLDGAASFSVDEGTVFQYGSLQYVVTTGVTLAWNGNVASCGSELTQLRCNANGEVTVMAAEAGEAYNISAHGSNDWSSSINGLIASNPSAFSGGTDNIVTVVQQSDIDKAKDKLSNQTASEGKAKVLEEFPENLMPIEASFKQVVSDPVSTPALGEIVADGAKAKIASTTTFTMYGVDKDHLEDYIKAKAAETLPDDQKVYDTGNPFFERFTEADGGYTARLKSTTQFGPKVTEQDILAKAKGQKIKDIRTLIGAINGVSSVRVEKSYFWVSKVPNDDTKITIELKVEE